MLLFADTLPDEIRVCTWCCQAFEPTSENFYGCKHGRHGLMTVCKTCQQDDSKRRQRYRKIYTKPDTCACGFQGFLEVDHDHKYPPYAFRSYKCRSCNLKAREKYVIGPFFWSGPVLPGQVLIPNISMSKIVPAVFIFSVIIRNCNHLSTSLLFIWEFNP